MPSHTSQIVYEDGDSEWISLAELLTVLVSPSGGKGGGDEGGSAPTPTKAARGGKGAKAATPPAGAKKRGRPPKAATASQAAEGEGAAAASPVAQKREQIRETRTLNDSCM
jgi:hypothetical protein